MSAPRIFIRSGMTGAAQVRDWEWTCTECRPAGGTYGYEWTIAAAADAGRAHLRKHHGWLPPAESLALHRALAPLGPRVTVGEPSYSRRCGVRTAACAAAECVCAESDADTVGAPEKPAQRFEVDWFPAGEHHPVPRPEPASFAPCDRPDCPICTHRQAVQRSIDTRE